MQREVIYPRAMLHYTTMWPKEWAYLSLALPRTNTLQDPCASFEHILGSRARPATPTARDLPKGDPSLVTRTTNREPPFGTFYGVSIVMSRQKPHNSSAVRPNFCPHHCSKRSRKNFSPTYGINTDTRFQAPSLLVLIKLDFHFAKQWSTSLGHGLSIAKFSSPVEIFSNHYKHQQLQTGAEVGKRLP